MFLRNQNNYICKDLPTSVNNFKLEGINHNLCLSNDKSKVEKICEIYINPKIHNMKLIKTDRGLSNEGQYLTGNKLIVEVALEEKILFSTDEINSSISSVQYETLKTVFIILPKYLNSKKVEELYKSSRLSVIPYILHTDLQMINNEYVNISSLLFLDVQSC